MDFITIVLSVALLVILVLNVIGAWWVMQLLLPLFHYGGPYVPSRQEDVDRMVELAKLTASDRVADLGSGDGRIVIAAAKTGVQDALGIEINGALVKSSRMSAKRLGLANARFEARSFWDADVSDRTVIFLYQVPYAMKRLETKLREELPVGARIISNDFRFVDWQPVHEEAHVRVYTKTAPS